jgi:hypothetical protein
MLTSDLRKSRLAKVDEFRKTRFTVVASSAESALKSALLVNGGGAVALLAFFGQATQQAKLNSAVSSLAAALLVLVIGTALAGIATGLSFLAQYGYFMRRSRSWFGKAARSITALNILLIMFSYAASLAPASSRTALYDET